MIVSPMAYSQVDENISNNISKSETLRWKTERDLLLMLESSEDRVIFAMAIKSIAQDTEEQLSDRQRYDGLKVAGSALFNEGALSDAADSFLSSVPFSNNPYSTAQMLASTAECYRLQGSSNQSYETYKDAMDSYLIAYQSGQEVEYPNLSAIKLFLRQCTELGKYDVGIEYAEEFYNIAINSNDAISYELGSFACYTAGHFADVKGDVAKAILYYQVLVDNYSTYENRKPIMGIMPYVRTQLAVLGGDSWESPGHDLVVEVMAIIDTPEYQRMPIRPLLADKLASAWEQKGLYRQAMALRKDVANSTKEAIAELALVEGSQRLANELKRVRSLCLMNAAMTAHVYLNDDSETIVILNEILNEPEFTRSSYAEDANELKMQIIEN